MPRAGVHEVNKINGLPRFSAPRNTARKVGYGWGLPHFSPTHVAHIGVTDWSNTCRVLECGIAFGLNDINWAPSEDFGRHDYPVILNSRRSK